MPKPRQGQVELICKEDGIVAGLEVFHRVFTLLDENVTFETELSDGDEIKAGQLMGVSGEISVSCCQERGRPLTTFRE